MESPRGSTFGLCTRLGSSQQARKSIPFEKSVVRGMLRSACADTHRMAGPAAKLVLDHPRACGGVFTGCRHSLVELEVCAIDAQRVETVGIEDKGVGLS